MATAGQEIVLQGGETPPTPPSGFHWQLTNIIFSDTGGANVYTLVEDDPGASAWTSDLQNQFTQGFLDFFRSLGLTNEGAGGFGLDARPICFINGNQVGTPLKFKADKDYLIVGANVPSGWNITIGLVAIPTNLVTGTTPYILDGCLICTTTSTQGNIGGLPKLLLRKDQTLFVNFGSANGACTVYLSALPSTG